MAVAFEGGGTEPVDEPREHEMLLPKPKLVTQVSPVTCWAASLESWTGAVRGIAVEQAGLIPVYGDKTAGGGLSSASVPLLASDYLLKHKKVALNPDWAAPSYPYQTVEKFSPHLVDELLTRKHLLLIYVPLGSATWRHMVVVYGVIGDKFSIMNPYPGTGFLSVESSYFFPSYRNSAFLLFGK